jgi:cyanophycinase
MGFRPLIIAIALIAGAPLLGLSVQGPASSTSTPKVGPPRGTVFAVGGGVSPDVIAKFIEAAGGPGALIIEVPTAGLDS